MKKLLLLLSFLTSTYSFAQVREIGLKTGITNSLLTINAIDPSGNKTKFNTSNGQSFYAQLYTQFYNYQNFSLQGGVGIIEKNSDYQYKIRVGNIGDSVQFNTLVETRAFFLELDAKLKLLIPELPKVVPYLLVGPQLSFLNKQSSTIPFALSGNMIQGNIGFGADIDFTKLHVFAEYNRLLSFNNNYSEDANYEYSEKTGIFLIGLKFLIKPKKEK
jgi:hypothetical protein